MAVTDIKVDVASTEETVLYETLVEVLTTYAKANINAPPDRLFAVTGAAIGHMTTFLNEKYRGESVDVVVANMRRQMAQADLN